MLPLHVAILSETTDVGFGDVARVSAAMQKQLTRDFGPIWGIDATVDAFANLEDVPLDYWPVIIRDDIQADGAAGFHDDDNGQPFSLVQADEGWELTVSHEVLEMLADPWGNRLVAGKSLKPGQGRVLYLVEVSDPSEAVEFSYTINGVTVSDFYTPQFFDPVKAPGVRYSFTGAITEPLEVLKGGYLSWFHSGSGHWFQKTFFGAAPKFVDLGTLEGTGSIRSRIDRVSQSSIRTKGGKTPMKFAAASAKSLKAATAYCVEQADEMKARAKSLHKCVSALLKKK